MHLCFIALLSATLFLHYLGSVADFSARATTYLQTCRHDNDNYVSQTAESSLLVCSRNCADDDSCVGFSTCPSGDVGVLCQLFDNASNGTCAGASPGCTYMEEEGAVYNPCQNGGSNQGSPETPSCDCPVGWTGKCCDRYYRDCFEASSLGGFITGWMTVQPLNYPDPFDIYCNYGSTFFLRRGRNIPSTCPPPFNPNGSIEYFKQTHGNPGDSCDYFLGLDKLSAILLQGDYIMTTFLQYHFPNMTAPVSLHAKYEHFTVQNESSGFVMDHGPYKNIANLPLNPDNRKGKQLFLNDRPRRFCTTDDMNCACAQTRDASWWYGNDCQLEFPLTASPRKNLKIPIDEILTDLSLAVMTFYPNYYY
ncbi:uncharacterized protein LOC121382301 [Gigantopelta aegis]|uniref:uncharacterized protein LOC121382301 n=1 Tax=Gigantopelta aegis TaxID=1735272 RepID=UPI001B88E73A|nr:uncharacterized protein LOC121382301 [Gigantopelta aegis]